MISTNEFQTGIALEIDDQLYEVIEFQHVKPGKGAAFVRTKLKNLITGSNVDRTFRAGGKVKKAFLERKEMEFLYKQDDLHYMMDMENYEQITLLAEQIGNGTKYLKENDKVNVVMHGENVIGVDIPIAVTLKVVETEPGVKGDTASGASKPAKTETGLVVQVPLFINEGDLIKIDTRTASYTERA